MSTTTIKLKDFEYRIDRIPARTQFHVWRRVAPLLLTLERIPQILEFARQKEMPEDDRLSLVIAGGFPGLAEALAKMTDEDVNYVIDASLSVVSRLQEGGKYAPVLAPNGHIMFDDLGMAEMTQLTIASITGSMGNFFDLLSAALKL